MYANLIKKQKQKDFLLSKSDVYSLGLTILELGVGVTIKDLYDDKRFNFDHL